MFCEVEFLWCMCLICVLSICNTKWSLRQEDVQQHWFYFHFTYIDCLCNILCKWVGSRKDIMFLWVRCQKIKVWTNIFFFQFLMMASTYLIDGFVCTPRWTQQPGEHCEYCAYYEYLDTQRIIQQGIQVWFKLWPNKCNQLKMNI